MYRCMVVFCSTEIPSTVRLRTFHLILNEYVVEHYYIAGTSEVAKCSCTTEKCELFSLLNWICMLGLFETKIVEKLEPMIYFKGRFVKTDNSVETLKRWWALIRSVPHYLVFYLFRMPFSADVLSGATFLISCGDGLKNTLCSYDSFCHTWFTRKLLKLLSRHLLEI